MRYNIIRAAIWASATLSPVAVFGQGALDFADPCIKAEGQYKSTADALRQRTENIISTWDNKSEPPAELYALYVEAVREAAYKAWIENSQNKQLLKIIVDAKPDFDTKAYFNKEIYTSLVNSDKEKELVAVFFKSDYAVNIRPTFIRDKEALDKKLIDQKAELDSSCKKDEFNRVFRATIGNAMMVISSNFAASENEKGDIAKAIRAVSGVSITDIGKYGVLGGPSSELRKVAEGIAGGENSAVRVALRQFDQTFNPANWRIDPPKIDIPKLPNIPLPKIDPPKIDWPKF